MNPTISIITICFNNLNELRSTCSSVDSQIQLPFEHIIIDGSTTKDILLFLENNPSPPTYRKWLCERDKGIADAFNKGINMAKGDIVVMLNSGDTFYDNSIIQTATEAFNNNPSIEWLHGKYKIFRANKWVIIGKPFEASKVYRGMRSLCHQTMFVRKHLHDKFGLYSSTYKIAMDYDFVLRIANEKVLFINKPLVSFQPEGVSSNNYLAALQEGKKAFESRIGKSFLLIIWQLRLKVLYYILKSPVGKTLYALKVWLKLENM